MKFESQNTTLYPDERSKWKINTENPRAAVITRFRKKKSEEEKKIGKYGVIHRTGFSSVAWDYVSLVIATGRVY